MKTADRFLAEPVAAPFDLAAHPRPAARWKDSIEETRQFITEGPRLFADNVAAYVYAVAKAGKAFVIEEFPSLAPPWPSFWIEYPNSTGRERRGVLVRDITEHIDTAMEGAGRGAIDDARANGYAGDIGWLVELGMYVQGRERGRSCIVGPVGWLILALDPRGRAVGNRWVGGIPTNVDPIMTSKAVGLEGDRLILMFVAALQVVAFLHCRNVARDPVDVPPKLDKRHRKDHGRPLLRFQTVRLDVPRRSNSSAASTGSGGAPALHIVPGNFHHYGDCCPGAHDPKGLLFGKLTGVYWVPTHARGSVTRGEVRSAYDLQVRSKP